MPEYNSPTDPQTPPAVVTDPEDFNRQQRFKEIHDARQRVTDYVMKFEERLAKPGTGYKPGTVPAYYQTQLAFRVSLYIIELLPLLEKKGGDDPYFSEHFPESSVVDDLAHFANRSGLLRIHEDTDSQTRRKRGVSVGTALRVFQVTNRAFSELGMDLDVAETERDAGFDYSDILEDGPPGEGKKPQIEADGSGNEAGPAE
jgi:hypothetical protein